MTLTEQIMAGVDSGTAFALPIAFAGGLVSAFNPCCLPMLPTVVALVSNQSKLNKVRGAVIASLFVLGFALTTAAMGALSAALGLVFGRLGPVLTYVLAFMPIVMGLHLLGVVRISLPTFVAESQNYQGHLGAVATGGVYALVLVPCATPILASILAFAAVRGSIAYGSGLLFLYGVGAGVPLIIMGSFMGLLGTLRSFGRHRRTINYVTAAALIVGGLYLLWTA